MRKCSKNTPPPPSWANRFLEWYCHNDLLHEIQGDLLEQFHKDYQNKGPKAANRKFILDVIRFFRPSSIKKTEFGMNTQIISNYVKVAFRILKKEKGYTFTNVLGLTLGITCSLFIYLWVQDELAYNQWPEEVDRIHYVHGKGTDSNRIIRIWRSTPQPLKKVLQENYPSIEKAAVMNWGQTNIFRIEEENLRIRGISASPELFDIFSIPFIQGGHQLMFEQPNTIAISENMAKKCFGENWKTIAIPGRDITDKNNQTFTICGVFKDIPEHSTLKFQFVIPYTHYLSTREWLKKWGAFSNRTFVKIKKGYNAATANDNIRNAIFDHKSDDSQVKSTLLLQAFSKLYLHNVHENGDFTHGRIDYVKLISISAILILLLAGANFVNLTTAKSAKRSKETGIRKVLGAFTSSIRFQFIMEAIIMTTSAFMLSGLFVVLLLPQFNLLVGKNIGVDFFSGELIIISAICTFGIGIMSGLYPAFYMASLNSILSMKGILKGDKANALFRKGLTIFQFIIAIVMIIGSITIYKQIHFIMNKNTGLDREDIITMRLGDIGRTTDYTTYKQRLLDMPGIEGITIVSQLPIEINNSGRGIKWEGKDESQDYLFFYILETDPDFITTLNVRLLEGRNFDWNLKSDTANYLVNQTAAKLMGLEKPVGVEIKFEGNKGRIIGLMEDFHMKSLREAIEPVIIRYDFERQWRTMIKVKKGQAQAAIASLEALHKEYNPDRIFEFDFLDDLFNSKYKSEQLIGKFTLYFTIVAVLICAFGLLSLVTFNTELKTKEIGIRKVLGASVISILKLIGTEFIVLVTTAFVIAAPLAYLIIQDWLKGFEFHIELNLWLFVLAGLAAMFITLATIANHSLRSALRNPVDSLRSD